MIYAIPIFFLHLKNERFHDIITKNSCYYDVYRSYDIDINVLHSLSNCGSRTTGVPQTVSEEKGLKNGIRL
jgi:hypothetical protein